MWLKARKKPLMNDNRLILTFDQGNTRGKATLFSGMDEVFGCVVDRFSVQHLLPIFDRYAVDGVSACFTTTPDGELMEWIDKRVDGRVVVAGDTCRLPFLNGYRTPRTLGPDRIASACGAVCLGYYPVVVADCGTALTLDVIDADLRFVGGNISPGISLRFKSLSEFTDRLPHVDAHGDLPEVGFDTATAIRAGVVRGLVGEIRDFYRMARQTYGCANLVLTGGDSALIYEYLSDLPGVIIEPRLVEKGLVALYNYNCNE